MNQYKQKRSNFLLNIFLSFIIEINYFIFLFFNELNEQTIISKITKKKIFLKGFFFKKKMKKIDFPIKNDNNDFDPHIKIYYN